MKIHEKARQLALVGLQKKKKNQKKIRFPSVAGGSRSQHLGVRAGSHSVAW
jgi:hypothetical protein